MTSFCEFCGNKLEDGALCNCPAAAQARGGQVGAPPPVSGRYPPPPPPPPAGAAYGPQGMPPPGGYAPQGMPPPGYPPQGPGMPPGFPPPYPGAPRRPAALESGRIMDFISFRWMITPVLMKALYALGAVIILIGGIIMMAEDAVLLGLGTVIGGELIWRVLCESLILLYSLHDVLVDSRESLKKLSSGDKR